MSNSNILDYVVGEYQQVNLQEFTGSYTSITKLTTTVNSITYNVAAYDVHVYADSGRVTEITEGVLGSQLTFYNDDWYTTEYGETIRTSFKLNSTTYEGTVYVDMKVIGGYTVSDALDQLAIKVETEQVNASILNEFNFTGERTQVGTDFNVGSVAHPRITALSSTRVAYFDGTNRDIITYDFDGSTWAQVGNALDITSEADYDANICALSATRIALVSDGNATLRAYDFDGTDWSQKGNALTISGLSGPQASICAMTSSRIAFFDESNDDLRAYDFDGTDWSQTGNDRVLTGEEILAMTALTSNMIVVIDATNNDIQVYRFNGLSWDDIGTALSLGTVAGTARPSVTTLGSNYVCATNGSTNAMYILHWTGDSFEPTNTNQSISATTSSSVTALGNNRVAYVDSTDDDLRVYDYALATAPPSPAFGTL